MSDYSARPIYALCLHHHIVVETRGSRCFRAGEVEDDIQERLRCLDCLEILSEAEVRAAWGQESVENLPTLQLGGSRRVADTPRPGYWPTIPCKCPVCYGMVHYNPELSSKHRGLGWTCELDKAHYWAHQGQVLAQVFKRKKVTALDEVKAFPFPEKYDPNREYPITCCPHCGKQV